MPTPLEEEPRRKIRRSEEQVNSVPQLTSLPLTHALVKDFTNCYYALEERPLVDKDLRDVAFAVIKQYAK